MRASARVLSVACGVVLALACAGLPAGAFTSGGAPFTGTMLVGKWFSTICDKDGMGTPSGRGLYLPGTRSVPGVSNGDDTREDGGVWRLAANGAFTGTTQGGNPAGPLAFTLNACGYLSAVGPNNPQDRFDGVGAACGVHKGHHGKGNLVFANGHRLKLFHLNWKATAGNNIPLVGQYQEYFDDSGDPDGAAKKQKLGSVQGLLTLNGNGLACLGLKLPANFNDGNGAQWFNAAGSLKFANMVVPHTKSESKQCKDYGDPAPGGNGNKKSHERKPGTHKCTAQDGGHK